MFLIFFVCRALLSVKYFFSSVLEYISFLLFLLRPFFFHFLSFSFHVFFPFFILFPPLLPASTFFLVIHIFSFEFFGFDYIFLLSLLRPFFFFYLLSLHCDLFFFFFCTCCGLSSILSFFCLQVLFLPWLLDAFNFLWFFFCYGFFLVLMTFFLFKLSSVAVVFLLQPFFCCTLSFTVLFSVAMYLLSVSPCCKFSSVAVLFCRKGRYGSVC